MSIFSHEVYLYIIDYTQKPNFQNLKQSVLLEMTFPCKGSRTSPFCSPVCYLFPSKHLVSAGCLGEATVGEHELEVRRQQTRPPLPWLPVKPADGQLWTLRTWVRCGLLRAVFPCQYQMDNQQRRSTKARWAHAPGCSPPSPRLADCTVWKIGCCTSVLFLLWLTSGDHDVHLFSALSYLHNSCYY